MSLTGPATVSPIGGHEMHLLSMSGNEELGRLFQYDIELLSPDPSIALADVLAQNVTVTLDLLNGGFRHFNGYVSRFSFAGTTREQAVYRATLRPWLWFLTRTSDSRIYNQRSTPDVVKRVFRHYGQALFDGPLPGHAARDFIVQYRETDFNFVSRLMEEEGIYYYFRHALGKHTLVFADSLGAHDKYPGLGVPYLPPTDSGRHQGDHLDSWRVSQEIQPAAYVMKEYDFKRPRADLRAVANPPADAKKARHLMGEFYDYPGGYPERTDGETLGGIHLDELGTNYETVETTGTPRALGVGQTFRVTDLPRLDQNREYLVVRAHYELRNPDIDSSGTTDAAEVFQGAFRLMDSTSPFRPARHTPRPIVQGPQTAIVVGDKKAHPDASEIVTDEHARVRVRFFWERLGGERTDDPDDEEKRNEDMTTWVRVSQVWAGSQWGAIHIPRVGQEVIVDFLEGDPDRPIVTGRIYNGDNMPPYTLPQNKTQSGIKSRSTTGGGPSNFNEIRFEDKKGGEELHVQAERDHSTLVKRNQSLSVGADRSVSVGGNETISVTGTRSSTITKKETQTFNDARVMTVALTDEVTITGHATGTYKDGRTETVTNGDSLEVMGSNKTVTVHGEYNTTADTQFQVQQGPNSILVKDSITVHSTTEVKVTNDKCTVHLNGGLLCIDAADEIKLTCGGSTISLAKDGTITITGGKQVTTTGGGSGVDLVAAGATMSGTKATVSGTSTTEVTGGIVKIN
jgi:type VI secretion system secreted protein VgrG